jgi:F-type H+-transporting ATPase subunit b
MVSLTTFSAAAAEKAEGGKEPSLFATDVFSYVWNLLMFLILLGVLWVFVWPKILEGLKAREDKQRTDLQTAEKSAREAEALLAKRQAELANAQKDAQAVIERSKTDAEQVASKIKADAEAEILRMKERATAEIEAAKKQALDEVYRETAEISTQIASRILKREVNAADQQQLVNVSLAELTKSSM